MIFVGADKNRLGFSLIIGMIGLLQLFIVIAGIIVPGKLEAHSLFGLAIVVIIISIRDHISCYFLSLRL